MDQAAAGVLIGIGGCVCVLLIGGFVLWIFFCLTIYRTLDRVAPRNRTMEPGMAFLNLVPIVNVYWAFHTANHVSSSLKNEFVERRADDGSDYGKTVGLVWASLGVLGILAQCPMLGLRFVADNPNRGVPDEQMGMLVMAFTIGNNVLSIAQLVLMIVYWVKIAGYGKRLDIGYGRDDRDDDDRYGDDRGDEPRPQLPGPSSTEIQHKPDQGGYTQ